MLLFLSIDSIRVNCNSNLLDLEIYLRESKGQSTCLLKTVQLLVSGNLAADVRHHFTKPLFLANCCRHSLCSFQPHWAPKNGGLFN